MKNNKLLLFILLFVILEFSCRKEETKVDLCTSDNIQATVVMNKISTNCNDVGLQSDISFGIELEMIFDLDCGENCSDRMIAFYYEDVIKNENGIKDFGSTPSTSAAVIGCNKIARIVILPSTKIDDPGPIKYELGDTIEYRFYEAKLCSGSGFGNCGEETILEQIPEYKFVYVLTEDDFDCN